MLDIAAFIATATSAVGLFDKIADQVTRFINNGEPQKAPPEHNMVIESDGDSLVSKRHGRVEKRITRAQIENFPPHLLNHIKTLEKSMDNYYAIWSITYPELALLSTGVEKARVQVSLKQEVMNMKNDLESILKFIEDCGFELDDHYLEIKHALSKYN